MLATYAGWVTLVALFGGQLCTAIDVITEYGPVRGQTIPVVLESGDFNVHSYWGIPYARSPVGSLRFAVSSLLLKMLNHSGNYKKRLIVIILS